MEPVVYLTPSCGLRGKLIPKPSSTEEEGSDVYNFLGVPFAEPPVRFCDPKPVSLWSGVRSATEFGAVCPQDLSLLDVFPFTKQLPNSLSEDCLFLNIWTPSIESVSRLPVMVWLFGGGFMYGFSDHYDFKALACFHNVVVVAVNYRVNSFGFLSVNDDFAGGNYGILDQIEALKWVQNYISNFGGDPENVTVFGASAGGVSASLLTVSPLAKGLFRRVIAQSGTTFTCDLGGQESENAFKKMYAHMKLTMPGNYKYETECPPPTASGSEIVEFLRRQTVDDLVAAFKDFQFTPVIDGRVFPTSTTKRYESGDFNECDLLVGCNSDEGEFLYGVFLKKLGLSQEQFTVDMARAVLTSAIGAMWTIPNSEKVLKAIVDTYLPEGVIYSTEKVRKASAECLGDFLFAIPTIAAASCHSRYCKAYVYHFCHRPPYATHPDYARADHGSEILYVQRRLEFGIDFNEEDAKLARQVATYWTNFARTGNPNGNGLEEWPEYNETTKKHLVLEPPPKLGSNMKSDRVDLWLNRLPQIMTESADANQK